MKAGKSFSMPPLRIVPPTLEGQTESSKTLKEWLDTEETVRGLCFNRHEEEDIDCSYRSITNCTFSHIRFDRCKLKSTHFTDVRFENCDLSNLSFAESSLFRVEFISCKLLGTNLPECILSHIILKECNARYLNLCMSKITQARFSACDLQSSDLSSCKFSSIAFEKCNLRESEFSHTPLRSIDLSQSDIEGIRANLSDLRGAIVNTRQALDLTALMGLKITNTDWNSGE